MPGFFEYMFGSKDRNKKQGLLTDEQSTNLSDYFNNPIENNPLYGGGTDYLQKLLSGSPEAFSNFERPYMENFQQNVIPGISHTFAASGTGAGGLNSSGYQNSVAQAGRGLQSDLAQLRSGLQTQALPQALQYAQQPYANKLAGSGLRTFENTYQPGSTGLVGGVAQGLAGGVGTGAGLGIGVGMGGGTPGWFTNWMQSKGNALQGAQGTVAQSPMTRVGAY